MNYTKEEEKEFERIKEEDRNSMIMSDIEEEEKNN